MSSESAKPDSETNAAESTDSETSSDTPSSDQTSAAESTDSETSTAAPDSTAPGSETSTADDSSEDVNPAPATGPDLVVGTFAVEIAGGTTNVQGKVKDGADAASLIWEAGATVGDCELLIPRVPDCLTPCPGSEVCVADETCRSAPTSVNVGDVLIEGIAQGGVSDAVKLRSIVKNYQTPADVSWDSPGFLPGDAINLSASGGDLQAFEIAAHGITPISVTSGAPEFAGDSPVDVTWEPESDAVETRVHIRIDISHHGGTRGLIECTTADDGSLSIDGSLVKGLMDQGVSGFPNIRFTRSNTGSVQTSLGIVQLKINSVVQQDISIEGLASCNSDEECPDGQTCADDRRCG